MTPKQVGVLSRAMHRRAYPSIYQNDPLNKTSQTDEKAFDLLRMFGAEVRDERN